VAGIISALLLGAVLAIVRVVTHTDPGGTVSWDINPSNQQPCRSV
jgi:hypothetical protein